MRKLVAPGGVSLLRHDHDGSDLPHWHVGWEPHGGGPHGVGPSGRVLQTLYDWEAERVPCAHMPLTTTEIWQSNLTDDAAD